MRSESVPVPPGVRVLDKEMRYAGRQTQPTHYAQPPRDGARLESRPSGLSGLHPKHPELTSLLAPLIRAKALKEDTAVNRTEYFPEALDRGPLPFGTAHVAALLVEYLERRANGRTLCGSGLFPYKLAGPWGQTGCNTRTTRKALVRFGPPPERYWPPRRRTLPPGAGPVFCSIADPPL